MRSTFQAPNHWQQYDEINLNLQAELFLSDIKRCSQQISLRSFVALFFGGKQLHVGQLRPIDLVDLSKVKSNFHLGSMCNFTFISAPSAQGEVSNTCDEY